MDKRIAYLVLSCDPFSDVWDAYGQLFNKFWPDCPYDKYLASHRLKFEKYGFSSILIGEDKSWSYGLKYVLEYLKDKGYDYVIPAFDDFMIIAPIDTGLIERSIKEFISIDGTRLSFDPYLSPKTTHFNNLFGRVPNKVPYRATLGFVVWNISRLLSIIDERESAWEFEKEGVVRSFQYDDIYCSYKPAFKHVNLIIKRKLVKKSYRKIKQLLPDIQINRDFFTNTLSETIRGHLLVWFIHYFPVKYQWKAYQSISKPTAIDRKESIKHK